MEKVRFGCDIDGVLIHTDDIAYLKYCEDKLGWNINFDVFRKTHSWYDTTGKSSLQMARAFKEFLLENERNQSTVPGSVEALAKITEFSDVYFVTSRRKLLTKITECFINQNFADVDHKELSHDNHETKATKLIEHDLDFFVDDSFNEISKILKNSKVKTKIIPFPSFHIQANWNEIKKDKRIIWLKSWKSSKDNNKIKKDAWTEITKIVSN